MFYIDQITSLITLPKLNKKLYYSANSNKITPKINYITPIV